MRYLTSQNYKFGQMPYFIFEGKYKKLKLSDKVGYMFLWEMYRTAQYVEQKDADGNYYVIYTNARLADKMCVSDKTVTNVKRRLAEAGLIYTDPQGYNKDAHKNFPYRIYLLQPDLSLEQDNKSIEKDDKTEEDSKNEHKEKITTPKNKNSKNADFQNTDKSMLSLDKTVKTLDICGLVKNSPLSNLPLIKLITDNTDNPKVKNGNLQFNFSTNNYSKSDVIKQSNRLLRKATPSNLGLKASSCFNQNNINEFALYAHSINELNAIMRLVLGAKKDVEKQYRNITNGAKIDLDKVINYEGRTINMHYEMTNTFRRFINRLRDPKKPKIKNQNSYLFTSYKRLFAYLLDQQLQEDHARMKENNGIDSNFDTSLPF